VINTPVDLPQIDEGITRLPEDMRHDLATQASNDLFMFSKLVMGYKDITVGCHGPLCAFADHNPSQFKLFLMPRGHFKSSVVTISRALQKVTQNPEVRILIANETATNAEHFLSAIKATAETNKIFRALYGHLIPRDVHRTRWSSTELQFNRKVSHPQPTIDTIGMTGAYTSRHYTHLMFDDLISEEAAKSKLTMDDVIGRFSKLMSLMDDPDHDTADIIGTRWGFYDLYAFAMQWLGPKLGRFIRGAIEDGVPIFPERFSLDTLALIRNNPRMGEYNFSCLYMNNPRNPELQDFNVQDLRFWRWSSDEEHVVLYDNTGEIVRVVPLASLDITVTLDVRYGEKLSSDRDSVVTVGTTSAGDAIVLDTWAKRGNPKEQIDYLVWIIKRYHPRAIGVAKVGYELMSMKYNLQAACEREGLYANVVAVKPGGPGKPHIRGLQPVAATGHLYLLPTQHQLRTELAEYPLGQFDDTADALALQLQMWRGLLSPEHVYRYQESQRLIMSRISDYGFNGALPGDKGYDPEADDNDPDFGRYSGQDDFVLS
jgi:hypothetical protein